MTALIKALDDGEEIEAMAIDHYQFYHYRSAIDDAAYLSYLKASDPITVGFLISGPGKEDKATRRAMKGHQHHPINPIAQCISRHSVIGRIGVDEQIIASIHHAGEEDKVPTNVKTAEKFFGKDMLAFLAMAALILFVILLTVGLIDHFICKKIHCKRPKLRIHLRNKRKKRATRDEKSNGNVCIQIEQSEHHKDSNEGLVNEHKT